MLEHGGNLAAAILQYGIPREDWLDLSTGINPNGYPIPEIPLSAWQGLPLRDDGLMDAAVAYYGCRYILPTAGSQAALQSLPTLRKPCLVAIASPMYAEHALAWTRHGHEVIRFENVPDEALLAQADVVILCNPNNPTAIIHQPEQLLIWHSRLIEHDGWLIVDEAFMDATPQFSIAKHTDRPGLIVLRSLGKFFGLAGARVGFVLADAPLLAEVEERLGPWPISAPAREVATVALRDIAWQEATRAQLGLHSKNLAALLSHYGLQAQSTALFHWVPTAQAETWHAHLAKKGIWTRKFAAPSALRFGLPPMQAWPKLRQALANFSG